MPKSKYFLKLQKSNNFRAQNQNIIKTSKKVTIFAAKSKTFLYSRNKGGHRSRKHSSHLARSISRVSNASAAQNDTTRERNRSGDESHSEEESMFKFSSMSSIDHLQGSASDLTTSKQKQRKKYSISSGLQSPKTKLSSPTVPRRQSENQKSIVRKLELVMFNFDSLHDSFER